MQAGSEISQSLFLPSSARYGIFQSDSQISFFCTCPRFCTTQTREIGVKYVFNVNHEQDINQKMS